MEIGIRKAVATDCMAIMELVRELAVFERSPNAVTVTLEHFIESGFGKKPVWESFVACEIENAQERIIGISLYYIRYSTWKGSQLYLEDLVVTEKARGKGAGKMLFERTLQEARNIEVSGMVWQVLDWNTPAIDFYKKYGTEFDAEWINCVLNLRPNA
jgi:GNAT superfamily N-acetyltransferase